MAFSSSGVRPTSTGPQVFICFCIEDVGNDFVCFLEPALREANINVFTVENELFGAGLANILKRIEDSETGPAERIALVIFSKSYTSSDLCLERLAKIKERKDQGRLNVIPIFYKLQPSVVQHLEGDYGNNFRELKRSYVNKPEKTQKWEEALVSIPKLNGKHLAEQSDVTSRQFISSIVFKIQKLLEDMAMKGNTEPELNRQAGSVVRTRQPERDESQGVSVVRARQLEITHSENPQKWAWRTINDSINSAAIEIATMIQIGWLKIVGTFKTGDLTPGTKYEVVFIIRLEDDAIGWEQPVRLIMNVIKHDGDNNRVDGTANLNGYIGQNWMDVLAGVFEVPPRNTPATITFTMYQYEKNYKKMGLVVKGVAIRPTN